MILLWKNEFLKVILHYFQQKTSKRGIDIEARPRNIFNQFLVNVPIISSESNRNYLVFFGLKWEHWQEVG